MAGPPYSFELQSSRSGRSSVDNSPSLDMVYRVTDLGSSWLITNAVTALITQIPASILDPLTLVPLYPTEWSWQVGSNAYQSYDITIKYTDPIRKDNSRQLQPGEIRWTCDTTGGKLHINVALSERGRYGRSALNQATGGDRSPPNLKGAIQLTKQGEARGTEIIVPCMKREVEYRFATGIITETMIATWERLTGSVNNATYHKLAAGECLFAGAVATNAWSPANITGPQVKFTFLTGKNRTNWTVGPFENVAKKAWDFMWVWYEPEKPVSFPPGGTPDPSVAEQPYWLYVDQVYPEEDFSAIGIGTG